VGSAPWVGASRTGLASLNIPDWRRDPNSARRARRQDPRRRGSLHVRRDRGGAERGAGAPGRPGGQRIWSAPDRTASAFYSRSGFGKTICLINARRT